MGGQPQLSRAWCPGRRRRAQMESLSAAKRSSAARAWSEKTPSWRGGSRHHVALLVVYPIKTVAPAQFETLRLLNHLNDALPGGGFRLDFSDGEITFRHCIHLGDAPLDPESVRCALALVCYAVDHALPQLAAVALGQSTYGEALARDGKQGGDN